MVSKGWKRKRRRSKHGTYCSNVAQTAPGTLVADPSAPPPVIEVMAYGPGGVYEQKLTDPLEAAAQIGLWPVVWVNVDGLGDAGVVEAIGSQFELHELAMEDVLCTHQRAKVDQYDKHLFIVLRMLLWEKGHLQSEQLSIFAGKGFVVTFQEKPGGDCLGPTRERIRRGTGKIRQQGADYLLYSLVDSVVDGYFPVVEGIGDELETLEDEILDRVSRYTPARVMDAKREVLFVRHSAWPLRDVVNTLTRDDSSEFVSEHTQVYLRDCYDHCMRIIDLVETQREMCSDMMDLYLSSVSNRMNEVMKVLTTITLLFMPPTLIAGIYGMNFHWIPELSWKYGYFYALGLMAITAIGFLTYSRQNGWLGNDTKYDADGNSGEPDRNSAVGVEHSHHHLDDAKPADR